MTPPLATVTEIERRMTPADYEREREQIRATYGDSGKQAVARREQELAKLFYRSGWTQEELAKKERCGRQYITRRLKFGQFMAFSENAPNGANLQNLSEGKFRDYWNRTDKNERNDRIRFGKVRDLLQSEMTPRRPIRPGVGKEIAERFADGKWHDVETIAKHVNDTVESLDSVFQNMRKGANSIGLCESRRHGKAIQYRMSKAGRKIDYDIVKEELQQFIDELKVEGRKTHLMSDPAAVYQIALRLEKRLDELAKQSADD